MEIEVSIIILLFICLIFLALLGTTNSFTETALIVSTVSSILFIYIQMGNVMKMTSSRFKLPALFTDSAPSVPQIKMDEDEDINKLFQAKVEEVEEGDGDGYDLDEPPRPITMDEQMINYTLNNKRRGGFNQAFLETVDLFDEDPNAS